MTSSESGKRGVGRPRNLDLDQLIRIATLELLADGGETAAALDDVAARAGVGKATIYRRWTTKREMILDAVTSSLPIELPTPDRGNLHADARELLTHLGALLGTSHARAARQLHTQLPTWPELSDAYRDGVLGPWQTALRSVATRAHTRGEVDDPAGVHLALEAAAAHLLLHWTLHPDTTTDTALDDSRVEKLVDTLVDPLPRG